MIHFKSKIFINLLIIYNKLILILNIIIQKALWISKLTR